VYKIKENYKKLSHILENIENKNPWININKYFYIPYEKIFNDNTSRIVSFFIDEEKAKKILNDILLQESIDKIKNNEQKILSWNKSDEQLNYEKLVNLTNECMWEKILRSQVHLSYDEFINQCDYVIWELKNMTNIWNLKQLTKNLIYITKEWIEFANIWMEEDLLLKKEWTDVGWWSPEWDALFNREDKNLENFKKYYPKLEEIMKAIKQDYKFTPEMDFYIPYSVINENTFRFTLHL
jgi:hypothetical protein